MGVVSDALGHVGDLSHSHHAKQLLWLLLWACMSLSFQFAARILVHYSDFAVPWFLALMSAALVAVVARILVFLTREDDASSSRSGSGSNSSSGRTGWVHASLAGVLMWVSVALNLASLRLLPLPVVMLVQAAGPAVSYYLAVLLLQENVQWASCATAALAFCSATAAVLHQHATLSTTGLALQAASMFLDVLWQRLHLRAISSSNSSSSSGSLADAPAPSGLALLADSAPAAVLVLLPAMLHWDLWQWQVQQYRLRAAMPLAVIVCTLLCCLMALKAQAAVLQGLTAAPTGPAMHAVRDVLLGLVAAKLLNEHLTAWQWVAYAVAQLAGVALWAGVACGRNSSGGSGGSKKQGAFLKLLPILG